MPKHGAYEVNGKKLKERRILAGFDDSKDGLTRFCEEVDLSDTTIKRLEKGGERAHETTLRDIAEVLKMGWKELLADPKVEILQPPPNGVPRQLIVPGDKLTFDPTIESEILFDSIETLMHRYVPIYVGAFLRSNSVAIEVILTLPDAIQLDLLFDLGLLPQLLAIVHLPPSANPAKPPPPAHFVTPDIWAPYINWFHL